MIHRHIGLTWVVPKGRLWRRGSIPNGDMSHSLGLARSAYPRGSRDQSIYPNGVASAGNPHPMRDTTPLGLNNIFNRSQGSRCAATLGYVTESPWDSRFRPFSKTALRHRSPSLLIILLVACALISRAQALLIDDTNYGFKCRVPKEFHDAVLDAPSPDALYSFLDHDPAPDNVPLFIRIDGGRKHVAPDSRLKESDIPKIDGITTTLQEFHWNNLTLDVLREVMTIKKYGVKFVVCSVTYPLEKESVQLDVGGPETRDNEVSQLFNKVAQGFENTRPLNNVSTVETHKLSGEERTQKAISGLLRVFLFGTVVTYLFIILIRAAMNWKTKK